MARRRLNTKFLGIAFTILIVLAAGALAAKKFWIKENPQQFIADGDMFAKQQQWDRAASNYGRAASLLPKDDEIWVRYGNALSHVDEAEAQDGSAKAFRQAVQINPKRKDAWQALLVVAQSRVETFVRAPSKYRQVLADWIQTAREAANKVAVLEADNPDAAKRARAKSIIPTLNVQSWLVSIPIPRSAEERALPSDKQLTDDQKVDAAIVELTQLVREDPGNTRAEMAVAQAKMRQAQVALQHDKSTDAYTLLDEAAAVFDEPLKADAKNVEVLVSRYTVLQRIQRIDPRPDMQQQYTKRMRETLDTAQSLVDSSKNLYQYTGVKCEWASVLAPTDPGRAETVLQDVMQKNPGEIEPRIQLAKILQKFSTRRGDGLAVLDKVPAAPPTGMSLSRRQLVENQIYRANQVRADILIDLYVLAADQKEKDRQAGEVQKCLDAMAGGHGDDWQFLKVRGRYELKSGRIRDSIQTLSTADQLSTTAGMRDTELLMYEADAYRIGQQTSQAILVLEKAMPDPRISNAPAPHMVLAQLYVNDHQMSAAKRHIDWLKVRYPDNPDVVQLQISALDKTLDKDEIAKLYQKLPEGSLQESLDKARLAHQSGNDAEAERILKGLHEASPKDVSLISKLGMFYVTIDRKDDARQLVDEALKANPGDPTLTVLSDAIAGKSNAEMDVSIRKQIDSMTDPYEKAMRLAELSRSEGKPEDEIQHLLEAEQVKSTNGVLDRLFMAYVGQRQFDKAEEYAGKLADKDADQAHGLLYKLHLLLAKGEVQSAIAIGRQLTNDFKEFSESWEALGEALQAAGQVEAAATQYQTALDKQGTNVKALRNLIACDYQMNRLDEARRVIADACRKFPDDATYRSMAVQHELLYGDPESVLDSLRGDVKKTPEDPRGYQTLAGALMRASTVRRMKGDNDAANAHVVEARSVLQEAVKRWPDEMAFTLQLAAACQQAGDIPAAETVLKAIADRPRWKDRAAPAVALAELYANVHKLDQAESVLRIVAAKNPGSPDIQLRLAQAMIGQGKSDEALKVLEAHQEVLPIRKARAELLLNTQRGPQAEDEVGAAVRAKPADMELNNLLLFVLFGEGKFKEARELATQSIATNANNLPAYYYRAQVNMQAQNPDLNAAIADLIYVRDRAGDNTEARLALADCYARKNDLDSAIRELETAVRAQPTNKRIRMAVEDLYARNDPPRWLDAEQVLSEGLGLPQLKDDPDLLRRQAIMWANRGEADKALASIRAAMAQMPNRDLLTHDYLDILLISKQYPLLMQESESLVAAPNCPWWVFDYRARARNRSGDAAGAAKDFEVALDKAGAEKTHAAASAVAHDIAAELGPDQAIEMVSRRAQASTKWKLVAIPLYETKGDRPASIKAAEGAIASMNTLSPNEQDELLGMLGSLYVTSQPPLVDKSIEIYQQILQRHPTDYLSMNNLACIMAEQANPPRLKEAMDYAERAYDASQKAGTNDLLVSDTKAWVMILNGQYNEGIDLLMKFVDKATFPDAHYHIAMGYLKKKMPENAQAELRSARDILDRMPPSAANIYAPLRAKVDAAGVEADKMALDKTQAKATP